MNRTYLVILGIAVVCVLSGCAGSRASGLMQMRLAEVEEIPGLLEFKNPNPDDFNEKVYIEDRIIANDKIYVEDRIIASDRDVERADAIRTKDDTYAVAVLLTESAARRILRAWSKDLRARLAVFIDGRPVYTMPMVESFNRHVLVDGNFNRRYAESVANRLNKGEIRAVNTDTLGNTLPDVPQKIDIRKNLRRVD